VSGLQDCSPFLHALGGAATVHVGRGEQAQTTVVMLEVVPAEKRSAERPGVLDAAEPFWELRPVLERFELGLRERIVVRDVRPRVALRHAKVGEQQRHRL
jgi:hypothetical protein